MAGAPVGDPLEARVQRPILLQVYYILRLYSGHRREGDFQDHLEQMLATSPLPLCVLSLDVANDRVRGNLADEAV
eukprot:6265128-Heterocapsa_arctica.AAC.1